MCSDFEIEKNVCAADAPAQEKQQKIREGQSRLIWSKGISRPNPGSERGVQVKIAQKIQAAEMQKTNLERLYEVLTPRSTVGKISPTTSVMKVPNRPRGSSPRSGNCQICDEN